MTDINSIINVKYAGKWMIFPTSHDNLASIWNIIKTETTNGNLGENAEVIYNKNYKSTRANYGIVSVYVRDYRNKESVMNLGKKIRSLINYENNLYHKPISYTLQGRYGKGSWIYKLDSNIFDRYMFRKRGQFDKYLFRKHK